MYNYIESEYKKNSSNRKFFILCYSIALLLYISLIISGLFDFDNLLLSMFILLSIFILIIHIIIFIGLEYKLKDWKLFFKFSSNKRELKEKLNEKDSNIIKKVMIDLKIKRRNDIKLIIEHYRILSITAKKKYNYIGIITTIITVFVSFKDMFVDNKEQLIYCLAFLFIILVSFSMLYFCFVQIVDLKDILSGNKNLYQNLEELFTKECINRN